MHRWFLRFLVGFFLLNGCFTMTAAQEVSLKQKIGQMLIIGFKGMELKPDDAVTRAILAQQIGGVILFDWDYQTKTYHHNIQSPKQLSSLTQQLQAYANQAANTHKNNLTPLFISIDYEGGVVNRLKEHYGFPKTISAEEIGKGSKEQAYHYAQQMAETLKNNGINMNFAPLVDVNLNPTNPIIGGKQRSFSSDPKDVTNYAAIFSKAYDDQGILCAYKHFPGHGSSTGDTHAGFVDVTATWKEEELIPYDQLLRQPTHCPIIMTAHVVNYKLDEKGYPASISKAITTGLLREKLNFDGVVVTDDMQMKAIADHYGLKEAIKLAINAGVDILIFGNQLSLTWQDPQEIIDIIYQSVMDNEISERRIDEAYQRVMKLKGKLSK